MVCINNKRNINSSLLPWSWKYLIWCHFIVYGSGLGDWLTNHLTDRWLRLINRKVQTTAYKKLYPISITYSSRLKYGCHMYILRDYNQIFITSVWDDSTIIKKKLNCCISFRGVIFGFISFYKKITIGTSVYKCDFLFLFKSIRILVTFKWRYQSI